MRTATSLTCTSLPLLRAADLVSRGAAFIAGASRATGLPLVPLRFVLLKGPLLWLLRILTSSLLRLAA